MGKPRGKRFGSSGRGRGRGRGGGGGGERSQRTDHQSVEKANGLYLDYYSKPKFVKSEEKEAFWSALRRELPNSFRFTGSKGHALPVQQRLKDYYIPNITSIIHDGGYVDPPTPLPWYPDELAWQMTTPKNVIRKFPPFSSFQKFLVSETSVGNISRQEAVSMIPPLVLDIKPGMAVLDLCAAPGSKACQLIEMVHGGEEARMRKVLREVKKIEGRETSPDGANVEQEIRNEEREGDWSDDGRATGLLIANDVDYKRAHLLIHQMKRLNSPNLIVTNHDATMYPSIKLPSDPAQEGSDPRGKYLKFDRILADVPCSGDGTCRKNVNVWKDWNPGNALGLHLTQVRILVRALQMLKVGGRVVYSTCSMNPVENEAVVASAIERCGGLDKVEIVDCSDRLPGLIRAPGLNDWDVMDKKGEIWGRWSQVEARRSSCGDDGLGKLVEGMFSPGYSPQNSPLKRCMRIYAHQQDTGAFFIAVLRKQTEFRARSENSMKLNAEGRADPGGLRTKIDKLCTTDHVSAMSGQKSSGAQEESSDTSSEDETATSIIAPEDEITANPIDHIMEVDDLIPYPALDGEAVKATATVTISLENRPPSFSPPLKHEVDDFTDVAHSTKRPRLEEDIVAPAPRGEEDGLVQILPPPGSQSNVPVAASTVILAATLPGNMLKRKHGQAFEEPFKYLDPEHEELQTIYNFYQLHPSFPKDRFMVRNGDGIPAKTIYYTSPLARDILVENEGKGLKFVHCGIKMFVKQDVQKEGVCRWRIQTEGLPILESWVGEERVVRLSSRKTLKNLLVEMFPKVDDGGWQSLGEIGPRVRDMRMGCCVLRVETSEGEDGFRERMVLPLWRSLHSLNLMLPKEDRKAMLLRIYNDMTPLEDHSKDRFLPKPDEQTTTEAKGTLAEDEPPNAEADDHIGKDAPPVDEDIGVESKGNAQDDDPELKVDEAKSVDATVKS